MNRSVRVVAVRVVRHAARDSAARHRRGPKAVAVRVGVAVVRDRRRQRGIERTSVVAVRRAVGVGVLLARASCVEHVSTEVGPAGLEGRRRAVAEGRVAQCIRAAVCDREHVHHMALLEAARVDDLLAEAHIHHRVAGDVAEGAATHGVRRPSEERSALHRVEHRVFDCERRTHVVDPRPSDAFDATQRGVTHDARAAALLHHDASLRAAAVVERAIVDRDGTADGANRAAAAVQPAARAIDDAVGEVTPDETWRSPTHERTAAGVIAAAFEGAVLEHDGGTRCCGAAAPAVRATNAEPDHAHRRRLARNGDERARVLRREHRGAAHHKASHRDRLAAQVHRFNVDARIDEHRVAVDRRVDGGLDRRIVRRHAPSHREFPCLGHIRATSRRRTHAARKHDHLAGAVIGDVHVAARGALLRALRPGDSVPHVCLRVLDLAAAGRAAV